MSLASLTRHSMPAALTAAIMVAAFTATPSFASSGWWQSNGGGAEGFYNSVSGRVTACDIKTDGYKAVVQIFRADDSYLFSVVDTINNDSCTGTTPTLFEGTHKIRVCVQKGTAHPIKCGARHAFQV